MSLPKPSEEYPDQIERLYGGNAYTTRSITFQVTDSCSCRCSYCVAGETMILKEDFSCAPISSIKIGDKIIGFSEFPETNYQDTMEKATVTNVFHRKAEAVKIIFENNEELIITPNHKVLVQRNSWNNHVSDFIPVENLTVGREIYYYPYFNYIKEPIKDFNNNYKIGYLIGSILRRKSIEPFLTGHPLRKQKIKLIERLPEPIDVYNLETSSHTYLANGFAVHNCYEQRKGNSFMTIETGRRIVDLLFKMYDEDKPDVVVNKTTQAIILDFIGGEPLLNIDVIDDVCTYFMQKCIDLNHPWLYTWRASMISNGDRYFDEKVQAFLKKFRGRVCFSITLDGPKELHDTCRVHLDGTGNFDNAFRAYQHYTTHFDHSASTKCTIAPGNLEQVGKIVEFFYGLGITDIHMNPAFEPEWTYEQAKIYYQNLIQLADYCLEKEDIVISVFRNNAYCPLSEDNLITFCGGYGEMLAFDPDGIAYPCLRYMKSSLGDDAPAIVIGDANAVYESEDAKQTLATMKAINRKTENTHRCFKCLVAAGCPECAAWNYQSAGGKLGSRNTNICPMHQAEALANCYYWNKLYKKLGENKKFKLWLPKGEALKIVSLNEFYLLQGMGQ